ncbi:MAG: VWA domain-containing protein [Deltaproteobacteria bacterium]|nr:VWA domain-containing protein [Deltaproteobacteria bacterium]
MADSDDTRRKPGAGIRQRLGALKVGDAAELLVLARERIRESPVEHAKAAADATRSLAAARSTLEPRVYDTVRKAVLGVARRDWTAAAHLAETLPDLARLHGESVQWVGDAVARAVQADRTLARQLARVLPRCASEVSDRAPRLRIITALSDLCRRYPGLGLAALPTVTRLLEDGSAAALASFLEEALTLAARNESVARSFLLRESRLGQEAWDAQRDGLSLTEVARTLQLYAEAHTGSRVSIRSTSDLPETMALPASAVALTDGHTVWLAPRLDRFPDDDRNFLLYKVALAHEVGRIEFGTFDLDPLAVPGLDPIVVHGDPEDVVEGNPVLVFAARFPDSGLARRVFLFADDLRVDACLRREYPGLARDMELIARLDRASRPDIDSLDGVDQSLELLARRLWYGEELPEGSAFQRYREAAWLLESLRHPSAKASDAASAASRLYRLLGGEGEPGDLPEEPVSPGAALAFLRGEPVSDEEPGSGAGGTLVELPAGSLGDEDGEPTSRGGSGEGDGAGETGSGGLPASPGGRIYHTDVVPDADGPREQELADRAERVQRALDARGVPASLREIMSALSLDPEISDLALERNLAESFREELRRGGDSVQTGLFSPNQDPESRDLKVARYPEWDEQIGDYRPRWCTVWERRASGSAGVFVDAVLAEHGPMVRRLRREFQMLRPEGIGKERRAREGDALDLDALVGELVDTRLGRPGEGRVYLRRVRKERDVAVAFLVDQSASTRELIVEGGKSVIEVEKESLVLLAEALEALGDRYGIFGFSGRGRQMVTFDVFKDFEERWDDSVRGRIGAMTYRMENRDGAAIRHATKRLAELDAKVRLLVLLSDGKPLDCGCDLYQAAYAQADTRMALREAREQGVHPFCITVDPSGAEYVGAMYGDVRYAVIESVDQLPARLPAIYRRLTT